VVVFEGAEGLGLSAGRVLFFAKEEVDPDKWPGVFRESVDGLPGGIRFL